VHPELAEGVLGRLGFASSPSPDLAGLRAVYEAWCGVVPFDNLVKRLHLASGSEAELPNLAPAAFFDDFLRFGTGGTCWPSSMALHGLLAHLGFRASLGVGAMYRDAPNDIESHGAVVVDLDHTRWWVDTAMATIEPLEFRIGAVAGPQWRRTRVARVDGRVSILWPGLPPGGEMGCRFLDDAGTPTRYRARYEWSREYSPFNTAATAIRSTPDRQLVLMAGRRFERTATGLAASEPLDTVERNRVLIDEFGYSEELVARLPADDPPPG
jgi:N-hydroxyarylamine O-acetyltransferase